MGTELAVALEVLENLDDACFTVDGDLRVTSWNTAAAKLYRLPFAEAIGRPVDSLLAVEDGPDSLTDILRTALEGGQFRGELIHSRPTGDRRWVSWTVGPLHLPTTTATAGALSLVRDIGDRRRTEQSLRNRAAYTEAVLNNISIGLMAVTPGDRVIRYMNPTMEAISGWPRDHFIDAVALLTRLIPDSDRRQTLLARVRADRSAGDPARLHWDGVRIVTAEGGERVLAVGLTPLPQQGLDIYTIQDVTARHEAESELRRSENRFRTLVTAVSQIVWTTPTDGRFAAPQPDWTAFTGQPEPDMLGDGWLICVHPEDRDATGQAWRHAVDGGTPFETEHRLRHHAGGYRQMHVRAVPVTNETGAIQEWVGIHTDVTHRKEEEEAQRRLAEHLRQTQKMESIGQLAGGVAHDFNNLLTGITGNISLALLELDPLDPLRQILTEVDAAARRAADLTSKLLAFSRKQIIEPRVIDLNSRIGDMRRMLGRLIGEDISLHTELADGLGRLRADGGQIDQLIMNLVVNARDAMPKGGRLVIRTTDVTLDGTTSPHLFPLPPGPYIRLTVEDTGCGMCAETLAKIFEPFFTTKPVGKGTGLGLATVYGIVKQHNGSIEVDSAPNRGSTFTIHFPRVEAPPDADTPARPRSGDEIPGGNEVILVVEDDPIVKNVAVKMLKRMGYQIHHAENGGEAFLFSEQYPGHIDLLLTDVVMPGMNGRALAGRLKDRRPDLKVLFTSGYTEDVIAQHGVLDRGLHFIPKPYTPLDLAVKVRQALDDD